MELIASRTGDALFGYFWRSAKK
ncbi:protein of unknown function [Cupriavidus taiwanensis]|nr:hypothetical protein CBM2606_A90594 [Cupriavidus taiwanensis]SPA42064.1 protein of unknown function [Cupriavidus taiwanensis]